MHAGRKVHMIGIDPSMSYQKSLEMAPFVGGWLHGVDFFETLRARGFHDGLVVLVELRGKVGPQQVTKGKKLEDYQGEVIRNVALI